MTVKFEPLAQRTTPGAVYDAIRARILDGTLPAGGQLREAHIAADMGISRAPLREALTKLEEEGLIVKIAFRGAFVAEVSAETIAEIACLRVLVEPYAVELCTDLIRGDRRLDLDAAVKNLHQATGRKDVAASIDAHLQFHLLFYVCAGNKLLLEMWEGWESKLRLFFAADHRAFPDLQDVATEHEKLAQLILTADMDDVRRELSHHIHAAPGHSVSEDLKAPSETKDGNRPPPTAVPA
jgi:DNA-binding GntR family transcriptional regulator